MKTIKIHHKTTQSVIFEGVFDTHTHALETAVKDGIKLISADLRGLMLPNVNLDGADLSDARLDRCDLTGANLSEVDLTRASFQSADLSLAVLSQSRLIGTDFTDTSFHGTLIDYATIHDCRFTCPSTLGLDFWAADTGRNSFGPYTFTAAPVVVTGLPKRIVFLDDVVLIGNQPYSRADFPNPFENMFRDLKPGRAVAD